MSVFILHCMLHFQIYVWIQLPFWNPVRNPVFPSYPKKPHPNMAPNRTKMAMFDDDDEDDEDNIFR